MDQSTPTPAPTSAPAPIPTPAPTAAPTNAPLAPLNGWPGAFAVYKYSRQTIMSVIKTLVLIYLFEIVIEVVIGSIAGKQSAHVVYFAGQLINLALSGLIGGAYIYTVLSATHGKVVEVGEALKTGGDFIVKYVLLSILVSLSLVGSLLLLIVPFFFVFPRLVLAPYFLVDQRLGVIEAYKASWHATKGHSGKVWGILGVSILMSLPIITIIGIILTGYWLVMYSAAMALLYNYLKDQTPTGSVATPTPTPTATPVATPPTA